MKIEVLFVGDSIDSEVYEAEYVTWVFGDDLLVVFAGEIEGRGTKIASYPQGRVVRVRVIA